MKMEKRAMLASALPAARISVLEGRSGGMEQALESALHVIFGTPETIEVFGMHPGEEVRDFLTLIPEEGWEEIDGHMLVKI